MLIPLRHRANPSAVTRKANDTSASGQAEHGLSRLTLTSTQGIEVEEVGQVEFTREWARAITRAALAQTGQQLEAADGVEDMAVPLPHSSP
ncbi:MAG: hypothetical protein FD187_2455 [bacterium]|nr:MAG: hypothetical protein FD142_2880 [bacterium]KAF0147890.1 MAG: hypothetical protein FD187_2455 [bacterium]KAF0167491.1 MAG: hypothetical protein FD158_2273 [bacterium]TXT20973.1 MAG: hypothetical protein FD132_891 [bacterium]